MNILQINTNDIAGGAATVAWSLKNKLKSSGHQTSMFVLKKESGDDTVREMGRYLPKYFHYLLANDLDLFFSERILKTEEFKAADVIHCHNLHGWFFSLAALKKMSRFKPVVWTFHDEWPITPHCAHSYGGELKNGFYECPNRKIYPKIYWSNEKYLTWRKRNIYKNADFTVVVPSKWLYDRVAQSVLAGKRLNLIPNGVDTKIFRPQEKTAARRELGLPPDKKIVMFLAEGGLANPFKNAEFLFKVKEILNDQAILFLCVGGKENRQDGDGTAVYVKKTDDKNLLARYYASSDVFLLPSLAENFPLVTLEAMASGLPVVSFDIGGVKEAVGHLTNGYLARPSDAEDLAAGVKYIFNLPPEKYDSVSRDCAEKVRSNYTLETMAKKYLELYQSLV